MKTFFGNRSRSLKENKFDPTKTQCLKITKKVAFIIASEASFVYILSGQKFIKNAKNGRFWASFLKLEQFGQTVVPERIGIYQNSTATF